MRFLSKSVSLGPDSFKIGIVGINGSPKRAWLPAKATAAFQDSSPGSAQADRVDVDREAVTLGC